MKDSSTEAPKTDKRIMLTAFVTNFWKASAHNPKYWQENKLANGETTRQAPLYKLNRAMEEFASLETAKMLSDQVDLRQLSRDSMNQVHRIVGPFHAARHRYHTKALKKVMRREDTNVKQVVALGAGLDSRSVSKKNYAVKFFEVDLPELVAIKTHLYKKYGIDPNATLIGANYITDNLLAKLIENGVDLTKDTHFIWEGNVMYLPIDVVKNILLSLQAKFTGNVTISFDYYPQVFIEKQTGDKDASMLVEQFAAMGAQFRGGIDDIAEFASSLGMDVLEHINGAELLKNYELDTNPDPRLSFFHMVTLAVRSREPEYQPTLARL